MYDSTFVLYITPDRSADSLFEWKLARCSSVMMFNYYSRLYFRNTIYNSTNDTSDAEDEDKER
ncbi:hypothetical protein T03_17474 [Trichinella britovi]|uniref:Uncharacterized protein n=1 Tax=Trichinella britovi TaxID=45882 RepID=A0A0V1DI70_TRIBR|nr:hypothetical protein T03_17474 [Trichinella britovi]